jgi:site-specific recombinase XerD
VINVNVNDVSVNKPLDITNDPKLQRWFDNFELSVRTQEVYTKYLTIFCQCINKTPSELIQEAITEIKSGLMPSERKIGEYVAIYKKYLRDKDLADKSQAVAIACIKSFFKAYDIPLPSDIRTPRKPAAMKENQTPLTKADVKKLITNAKNLRDKAIILLMATSGMARREIRTLRMKNMSFDSTGIAVFDVFREKTKTDYITFGSVEATKAIKDYIEERNRDERLKVKGKDDLVFVTYVSGVNSKAGDQIGESDFTHIFGILAGQLGFKNGDYFIKTRSHALRSFFSSTLENAGCPKSKVDFMLGHSRSGTDTAYFHPDRDLLKQLYIDYLPYLSFETIPVIKSLKTEDEKRLADLEKENEKLKAEMQGTKELKERLVKLEQSTGIFDEATIQKMLEKMVEEKLKKRG